MELTVRKAAALLGVSENTIHRWIEKRTIPAYQVNESYRFNQAELLEWANSHQVRTSSSIMEDADESGAGFSLENALRTGGVFAEVGGDTVPSALESVVARLPLPPEADREFLLQMLLARERAGSTGIGGGVAIPHARNPIVLSIPRPILSLCYLRQPIDFGAIDGQPVHTLFTIVSPTIKTHLGLLSRLAFALREAGFAQAVAGRSGQPEILAEAGRIDAMVSER
jgi:PTS system nitrogen regulatory IIA component